MITAALAAAAVPRLLSKELMKESGAGWAGRLQRQASGRRLRRHSPAGGYGQSRRLLRAQQVVGG